MSLRTYEEKRLNIGMIQDIWYEWWRTSDLKKKNVWGTSDLSRKEAPLK